MNLNEVPQNFQIFKFILIIIFGPNMLEIGTDLFRRSAHLLRRQSESSRLHIASISTLECSFF